MNENKISLILTPDTYDYVDGEITYRIFANWQLICERSMPILSKSQQLVDTLILKKLDSPFNFPNYESYKEAEKNKDYNFFGFDSKLAIIRISIHNLKLKKVKVNKIIINDLSIDIEHFPFSLFTKSCNLFLTLD